MSSDPNYEWKDLLDIDDSDLPLNLVLCPYNSHVRETITITSTQNTDGIVPVDEVEKVEKKPVRIIPGPAGIVQLAKIRKQSPIHEGGDDSVLSTQDYMKQVVEDVGEDEDFFRDIKTFLKNGKLEQVVAIIKSCSPNALGDLKVTVKDLSGSIHGGSGMLMEEEEIMKLVKEEEMADLELHVCGNVIDQEDLYKFDEEEFDLLLKEEVRESRALKEWLQKCRQQEEEDVKHERQLLGFHGTIYVVRVYV
nr:hypothetical protein [Tanacetum cinerariifolium]